MEHAFVPVSVPLPSSGFSHRPSRRLSSRRCVSPPVTPCHRRCIAPRATVSPSPDPPAPDADARAAEAASSAAAAPSQLRGDTIDDSWRIYTSGGNKCVICFGKGATRCLYCYGEGTLQIGADPTRDTVVCTQCTGAGTEICRRCDGSGIRPATRYDVNLGKMVPNLTNEQVCNLPTYEEMEQQQREEQEQQEQQEQQQQPEADGGTDAGDEG